MEIIIIDKTIKGGYQARVHGKPHLQVFAKSELLSLVNLIQKISDINYALGKKGNGLDRIYAEKPNKKIK